MGLRLPPDLPRLVITPDAPTLNVVRQQSRHDRICTLEATAVLIKVWHAVGAACAQIRWAAADSLAFDCALAPAHQDLDPASDVPDKLLDMLQSVVREELTVRGPARNGPEPGVPWLSGVSHRSSLSIDVGR